MEPGTFEVVPRVRLRKRKLVDSAGTPLPVDAVAHVRALAAKGPVCVVDVEGQRRNKADLDTLRKMADKGNVWADTGSRYATDVMDALVAGGERVVLRWSALVDEEELREAVAVSDALLLGLEFNAAFEPSPRMGGEERALALARELELGILVIDTGRDGTAQGANRALAARFQSTGVTRWYAGGVRDRSDARELEAMGYRGCLASAAAQEGGLP